MKKVIRKSVFETNSSSMHSISISYSGVFDIPKFGNLSFGEFGWEVEKHNDANTKLSYVLTMIQYKVQNPEYVYKPDNLSWNEWDSNKIKINYEKEKIRVVAESNELIWIKELLSDLGVEYEDMLIFSDMGYIDHQSNDTLDELWSNDKEVFKENMKNFIFNRQSILMTDNDNH